MFNSKNGKAVFAVANRLCIYKSTNIRNVENQASQV